MATDGTVRTSDTMGESFFPIPWTANGRRTGWPDGYARAAAA
jgi:hypothetical protein